MAFSRQAVNQDSGAAAQIIKANPVEVAVADAVKASQLQNNQGVYQYIKGATGAVELYTPALSTNYTVTNSNVADATSITAYMFNNNFFNTTPDSSGTGAGNTVTKTYDDGWNGKLIERTLAVANYGRGLRARFINIIATDASGNQSPVALSGCQLTLQSYTGNNGKPNPFPIPLSQAIRNTMYQSGTLTIELDMWVNAISQISFVVPKGCTLSVTVDWDTVPQTA